MSTSALRTGVTFALGAMFGSLMTQGMYHCRHRNHEHGRERPWCHCPRQAKGQESSSAPMNPRTEGPHASTPTVTSGQ
ncbi:hypothetical protein CDL15_Pgr019345 [Punica granatum]|uniref:Uncharacterized protein n=1 Tax=Punica granatum TaxID=22663 RepID=A0A218X6P4_PUNGR|nr:hypothetical protein CDL15_Pgr019345 [Punica granatum]